MPTTSRLPVIRLENVLLVTIQEGIRDRVALALLDDIADEIVARRVHGVVIDISALDVVDSFMCRVLGNVASMASVLDAETVLVGMQPDVAITLVELGMTLPGVRTALSAEKGVALLREAAGAAEPGGDGAR